VKRAQDQIAKGTNTLHEFSEGVNKEKEKIKKRKRKQLGIKKQIRRGIYPVKDIVQSNKFHENLGEDLRK